MIASLQLSTKKEKCLFLEQEFLYCKIVIAGRRIEE
jgi:hypothetical protein